MPSFCLPLASLVFALALVPASAAMAQEAPPPYYTPPAPAPAPDTRPDWTPRSAADGVNWAPGQREAYERARAGWLNECRRRMTYAERDDGVGGGLIGGLFGGLLGNRLGGRNNRTFGTIAGAAVGAVAGAAIDKAEDRGRSTESDYCESYLDYHSYAGTQQAGYGYGQPVMMVAVAPAGPMPHGAQYAGHQHATQPECTEEVVYEDVDVPVEAPARRVVPRRPAPVKRVPDKRVPL